MAASAHVSIPRPWILRKLHADGGRKAHRSDFDLHLRSPELLNGLLTALTKETQSQHCATNSIVIVDNGESSSQDVVDTYREVLPITYQRLSEPGLVVARNASLSLALKSQPQYLVFIDDDEVPISGWLDGLVLTMEDSKADLANGPVVPKFQSDAPHWAEDFFTKSGENCCTSNLIIRATALPADEQNWFNRAFNYTGGEDNELLGRLVQNGLVHATATSAPLMEIIPTERLRASYVFRVGLRDGVVIAQKSLIRTKAAPERHLLLLILPLQKLLYGFNHLLWSVTDSARSYRALHDFASALGILLRLGGKSFIFYGRR